jgi:hypothetical protein
MMMNFRTLIIFFFTIASLGVNAQSKTTEALHKKNTDALALFFYNNTLRMLNQNDDPEFDALIKNIEKMKFLMISKKDKALDFKKLVSDYKSESFEEAMTSRYQGKNFDVYVQDKNNKTSAMLVLVNDEENLYVLDIVGHIDINNITKFYSKLGESSDIAKKIKSFTGSDDGGNGMHKVESH